MLFFKGKVIFSHISLTASFWHMLCTSHKFIYVQETSKAHPDSLQPTAKKDLASIIMKKHTVSMRPSSNDPFLTAHLVTLQSLKASPPPPNAPFSLTSGAFVHRHSDYFCILFCVVPLQRHLLKASCCGSSHQDRGTLSAALNFAG